MSQAKDNMYWVDSSGYVLHKDWITVPLLMEYTKYQDRDTVIVDVSVPGYTKDNIVTKIEDKKLKVELKKSIRELENKVVLSSGYARYINLSLDLKDEQLLSHPKVTLANGMLTFVWQKNPKTELSNITLTIS